MTIQIGTHGAIGHGRDGEGFPCEVIKLWRNDLGHDCATVRWLVAGGEGHIFVDQLHSVKSP